MCSQQKKAPVNENCPANEIIFKEDQCKDAAKQIGQDYWKKLNSDVLPLGCFNDRVTVNGVMFNENVMGPNKPGGEDGNRGAHGGLCVVPGTFYYTKYFI